MTPRRGTKGRPQTDRRDRRGSAARPDVLRLYGTHAVTAALANPRRVKRRLLGTEDALSGVGETGRVPVVRTDGKALADLLPPGAVHQGLVLETEPLPALHLMDVLESGGPVLILDQVTDPHNVGAILRSAAAFEAAAVVTQDRHSPPESGALAKAASGCLELTHWARVVNLSRALDELAEAGYWRVGMAGEAERPLASVADGRKIALVLGAEGAGLRPNVAAHCDELAHLPISSVVESLNVSNAAAIALYILSAV